MEKTPAHNYTEFRFRSYAPFAFKNFRQMFEIEEADFLASLCNYPMVELSNPGATGAIFYLTQDDRFICKTVQHKEALFLQKLLPGYYMNLKQNPRTLLPKFFGLYCYACNAKNVRITIMNNLLPSGLRMHLRFDLKGSTYKRKASKGERSKSSPTYKDLDFLEMYPEGIIMQPEIYDSLMNSIQRDCRVLESFKIMDYSLLIGVHNLDQASRDGDQAGSDVGDCGDSSSTEGRLERQGSGVYNNRDRAPIAHSTALESITALDHVDHGEVDLDPGGVEEGGGGATGSDESADRKSVKNVWGGIPARNHRGENLLLFIGIIDILQVNHVVQDREEKGRI